MYCLRQTIYRTVRGSISVQTVESLLIINSIFFRVQLWQHMKTQHGGSSSSNSESDDSEGSLELSVQKYINKDKPDSEICQAASRKQPRRNAKQKSV